MQKGKYWGNYRKHFPRYQKSSCTAIMKFFSAS